MTEPTPAVTAFAAVVAKQIKRLAFDAEIAQSTVAEKIDMDAGQFSRRMSGQVDWRLSELLAVARFFGVPLSDIAPDLPTEDVAP